MTSPEGNSRYINVSPEEFAIFMQRELNENQSQKGDWYSWVPNKDELKHEIQHHVNKLMSAIDNNDRLKTIEHAADLGNICMKALELAVQLVYKG